MCYSKINSMPELNHLEATYFPENPVSGSNLVMNAKTNIGPKFSNTPPVRGVIVANDYPPRYTAWSRVKYRQGKIEKKNKNKVDLGSQIDLA